MKVSFYNLPPRTSGLDLKPQILHDAEIGSDAHIPSVGEVVRVGFLRYRVVGREFCFDTGIDSNVMLFCAEEPGAKPLSLEQFKAI